MIGRFVLFGLLAIDALLQIRHAPRYGVGGFNVAQLPGLDAIGPSRMIYELCELFNAYLFVLAACGVATRFVLPIATAIYAYLYFGSQLDSYQHHYLVSLILLLSCFIPWQRPDGAGPSTQIRSWALRLVLIQIAIMYLWAAVSKMNHAWIDGRTLGGQIGGPLRAMIDATIGIRRASSLVIGIELALAASVWNRRLWRAAAPLGLMLHLGILASGLEIGLFAWLMIGLYIFIIPDRIWVWLAGTGPVRLVRDLARVIASWFEDGPQWGVYAIALAAGLGLAALCRFDHALQVGFILTAAIVGVALVRGLRQPGLRRRVQLAWLGCIHVVALGTWLMVDRSSSVAEDYYRFLAGSARRFGTDQEAEHAYRKLVAIVPDDEPAHFHLAHALLARDATEEGLAELHEAERLAPSAARAYVEEARWLASHARKTEALAKAREAVAADPKDSEARDLLNSFKNGSTGKRASPTIDDDSE
ncbi:MAG: hypothetical protein JWO36_4227 [Myxococcales bacterium]|nr:hypothetical protein [Myxococcales bacterium]